MLQEIFFEKQGFLQRGYSLFCQCSCLFLKGVGETLFCWSLSQKVSTTPKSFLETLQKFGKIVDIHFFENVAFEKKLPVLFCEEIMCDFFLFWSLINFQILGLKVGVLISSLHCPMVACPQISQIMCIHSPSKWL